MNNYKSVIAKELSEYLSIRQMTLTPKSFKVYVDTLKDFDKHLAKHDMDEISISEDVINGWIEHLKSKNHSRTVSNKVSCLRGLLKYLNYNGISVFMPPCPKYNEDYSPYIYSDDESEKIFACADNAKTQRCSNDNKNRITADFQVAMLIRLLYGCGLRRGEALNLIRSDVDFSRGTLLIRQAKNKKQRIVAMHKSLTEMLMQYCVAMKIYKKLDSYLFPEINSECVRNKFRTILKSANIYKPTEKAHQRGQCLHCFRHVFAVKSFAQAEKNGYMSMDSIPYLSVYLGHFDMDGTEKYLKFSSDIFPEHTQMFETYSAGIFTEIGGAQ